MGIVVIRKNGAVLVMPKGAEAFHSELKRKGVTTVLDKETGRTYEVRQAKGGMHFTEQSTQCVQSVSSLIIRSPKLPLNK